MNVKKVLVMLSVMQSVLMTQNICQAVQSFDHQGNLTKEDGTALTGEVLTTSEIQTMTNKTINSGSITGTTSVDTSGKIKTSGTIEVTSNGAIILNTGTARPYIVSENQTQQMVQSGFLAGNNTTALTVTFPVAFSGVPTVIATPYDDAGAYNNNMRYNVWNVTASGFDIKTAAAFNTPDGFYWIAIGSK